jgi:spore germination cell wall hydrolase CwlJ-like protein
MALLSVPAMYQNLKKKYFDALYFHATYVRPSWSYEKFRVARVAGHIFYRD